MFFSRILLNLEKNLEKKLFALLFLLITLPPSFKFYRFHLLDYIIKQIVKMLIIKNAAQITKYFSGRKKEFKVCFLLLTQLLLCPNFYSVELRGS